MKEHDEKQSADVVVSVIVATYRRNQSLVNALESLAQQVYRKFEVIVVDDNADEAWNLQVQNIIKEVTCRHTLQVRYLKNECNLGSAKSRNLAIEQAAGKYITFLDDDDIYLADKIERQLSHMQKTGADYCVTDLLLYNAQEKLVDRRVRSYLQSSDASHMLRHHFMHHITGTDTLMFTKDYLVQIGMFPPIDVGDEFYLMKEAIVGGGVFAYLPGCGVKAYVHEANGGLSSGEHKISGENALFAYKKQFFDQLDTKAVRYITMRHHAVLAFAQLHNRKYPAFFCEGIQSFIASPVQCVKMLVSR